MIFLDTETYSEVPIQDGTYRYAERCEINLVSWARDDGAAEVLDVTAVGVPAARAILSAILEDSSELIVAHNSMFDRNVLRLGNLGIEIPRERWRCAMVRALAHGLPGRLEELGRLLLPAESRKLGEGRALVLQFCKPRDGRRATRITHPERWAQYIEYARQDIVALRAVWRALPNWNYPGQDVDIWLLDQQINDRGFYLDLDLVAHVSSALLAAKARLREEAEDLTDGAVESTTQSKVLLSYLAERYDIHLPNLQSVLLEKLISGRDSLAFPPEATQLLINRMASSKTSTSKYARMARTVSGDGVQRGALQFNAAARTGRWGGRLIQPQNFPSRGLPSRAIVNRWAEAFKLDALELIHSDVPGAASAVLRGVIVPAPGCQFYVADLSGIEGRGLAWLASEDWKVQAYEEFDAGIGPDLYALTYCRTFGGDPLQITKAQRTVGKVEDLAFGYAGGIGACVTFAEGYGLDLDVLADQVRETTPADAWRESEAFCKWLQKRPGALSGLRLPTATAFNAAKLLWRRAHPATTQLWENLEEGFKTALLNPGSVVVRGRFQFDVKGSWLRIRLPSGRYLCYPNARIEGNGDITYMGIDAYTRKWKRIVTHGGKIAENATQSFAGHILRDAMPGIEAAGFEIVLTVHDEVVAQAGPTASIDELCRLFTVRPEYAPDLPLAAKGFVADRYGKDD